MLSVHRIIPGPFIHKHERTEANAHTHTHTRSHTMYMRHLILKFRSDIHVNMWLNIHAKIDYREEGNFNLRVEPWNMPSKEIVVCFHVRFIYYLWRCMCMCGFGQRCGGQGKTESTKYDGRKNEGGVKQKIFTKWWSKQNVSHHHWLKSLHRIV